MFDEQPDDDPHGECAAEIAKLRTECSRLLSVLMRYRYAVAYAAADAWDGGIDIRRRFEWAHSLDPNGRLSNDEVAGVGADFHSQFGITR